MRISDWSSDVCSSDLPSVASLRQRLGRSGRRKGEPAILRGYCVEYAINERASLDQMLRLHTVQTVEMISLLLEGWFEPPAVNGQHLSTLVMQMLSHVAQCGGAGLGPLYTTDRKSPRLKSS